MSTPRLNIRHRSKSILTVVMGVYLLGHNVLRELRRILEEQRVGALQRSDRLTHSRLRMRERKPPKERKETLQSTEFHGAGKQRVSGRESANTPIVPDPLYTNRSAWRHRRRSADVCCKVIYGMQPTHVSRPHMDTARRCHRLPPYFPQLEVDHCSLLRSTAYSTFNSQDPTLSEHRGSYW